MRSLFVPIGLLAASAVLQGCHHTYEVAGNWMQDNKFSSIKFDADHTFARFTFQPDVVVVISGTYALAGDHIKMTLENIDLKTKDPKKQKDDMIQLRLKTMKHRFESAKGKSETDELEWRGPNQFLLRTGAGDEIFNRE